MPRNLGLPQQNEEASAAGCLLALVMGAALWALAFWIIAQAHAWWRAHVG